MYFLMTYLDILYLNKQRLLAIEELNKAQRENNLLLARIEQLEAGEKASSRKGDAPNLFIVTIA